MVKITYNKSKIINLENMKIDLQGFGVFDIEESNYPKLIEILNLDDDLFLDILDLSKFCVPVLCINVDKVESEGPQPLGFNKTQIGIDRFDKLTQEGIVADGEQ